MGAVYASHWRTHPSHDEFVGKEPLQTAGLSIELRDGVIKCFTEDLNQPRSFDD